MKLFLTLLFFILPCAWTTRLNANYVSTKTFLLYLGAALTLLVVSDKIVLRKFPKFLVGCFALIAVNQLLVYGYYISYESLLFSFKQLSFLFLALYFYNLDMGLEEVFEKCEALIGAMFTFIIVMTVWSMVDLYNQSGAINTGLILSTFGNVNMFSEFMILTLPALFYWTRSGSFRAGKLSVLSFILFFIVFCNSRSAWIGLGLWFLLKLYQRLQKKEWLAIAAAALMYAGMQWFLAGGVSAEVKAASAGERRMLYTGSFEYLLDHPFGMEVGRFLSEIVPYLSKVTDQLNEYTYFDQPHSEVLKWGLQYGWLMFVLALAVLGALFIYLVKAFLKRDKKPDIPQSSFFLESFVVLMPQVFFQFPFENPASILYIALLCGLYAASFEQVKLISLNRAKIAVMAVGVVALFNSFLFITSIYMESTYPRSSDIMHFACDIYPINIKTCFLKHLTYSESRNVKAFQAEYVEDMQKFPLYVDYLRVLPYYYNMTGNSKKMCESVKIYGQIYKTQKNYNQETEAYCQNTRLPFDTADVKNFTSNYVNWLKNN